jgi:aspartate 1-decarboxylase
MQRSQLKSKIHRAVITDANVSYEGSITIPRDLMAAADLWEHERVLVASITSGARLETYVIPAPAGSGEIVINGGAAHLISTGHLVTIMAFTWSEQPVEAQILICDADNKVVRAEGATAQRLTKAPGKM